MSVKVTFTYEPEEPDDGHPMGVSNAEYERVMTDLMMKFGAEDVEFEKTLEGPRDRAA